MIFTNSEIIRSSADLRVGGIETDATDINYLDYTEQIRLRFIKLANQHVRQLMANGMTKEEAMEETLYAVQNYLSIPEKTYDYSIEGIADEILKSDQYKNWEYSIYSRFLEFHPGVVGVETPIPVKYKKEVEYVNFDDYELHSLSAVLEGLISAAAK